ncbi:MAG: glycine cleavage system aminomethyltransferase GcvT [Candidatus Marinimicrobia bacterium]|nr:glycine cleavage system aminomethyltransferase GcvT [Candidatus Neomarinimicrobiota bacterium]
MTDKIKRTALFSKHEALGARIVPFAGFEMPLQYEGVIKEHLAVRTTAGVFDVSHMGEFIVKGKKAGNFLNYVTINDVSKIEIGQAQYSAMCYDDGGIIDDLLIYRYKDHYMLVVNASNIEKDFNWLNEHLLDDVLLENRSDEIGLIAVQGPKSREILFQISESGISDLPFYYFLEGKVAGHVVTIARTGYTGELGFEIYGSNEDIPKFWDALFNIGKPMGLVATGLAARDTLRLEMKFCLYGNDIDKTTHPYEAGLGWITKVDKENFIGRDAIIERKENITRRLVCIEMLDKAIPRQGYEIYVNDEKVGYFTSGGQSPSLQKGIGLAYINRPHTKSGTEIEVEIRGKRKKAVIVKPPFYKDGTSLS